MSKAKSKIRKAKGREEEDGGTAAAANNLEGKELLCCLPEGQGNAECSQRVIEDPHSAVKMTCSSVQCTMSGLLHAKCFDRLEKHLFKALAVTPTGKKWTETQLKANVWNCRGAEILHRFSKCSCGGTLNKVEEENKSPVPVVKKKEKEKSSQKPKLNCDGVKISYSEMKMFKKVAEEKYHVKASPEKYGKTEEIVIKARPEPSLGAKIDPLQIFAGNLPNDCTENELFELFGKFGKVTELRLHHPSAPCDYFVPSFSFVAFESTACVQRVLSARPILLYGNHKVKVEEKKWCEREAAKPSLSKPPPKSNQLPLRSLPLLKADLPKKKYNNPRGYNAEDHSKILHVSSLPEDCCENDLGELFEKKYGKVTDVWISTPTNFAFITFDTAECVERALADTPIAIYGQRLQVDRKKPRNYKLSTSSSSKDECTCPPRLCTCATSIPKPPPCPQPAVDASSRLTWAGQALPHSQMARQEDWMDFETIPEAEADLGNQDFRREANREFFQNLLGKNCPADQDEEVFESDEEDEVEDAEFQSAAGTNEDCGEVEERQRQEELDDLFFKFKGMVVEKTLLEQEKNELVSVKMHQERELLEAKNCIQVLEQNMRAFMEQQLRERENAEKALANAKASNKVLREKMESFEEQLRGTEVKEKLLEQKFRQEQDLQERLGRENETLQAEVHRLTGALESMSKGGNGVGRMVHGTRSAPGGLESLAPVWECSTCTYHNPAVNLICDMCSKSRPAPEAHSGSRDRMEGQNCSSCSLLNRPGTRSCLACGTSLL